jgi:DNA polymerase
MGADKFIFAAKAQGKVVLAPDEAQRIVTVYRQTHGEVVKFWKRCEEALACIAAGKEGVKVDHRGVIVTTKNGLRLPNGLEIKYPDLKRTARAEWGEEWTYFDGKSRQKIYGAKVCENIVQALARIIVMEQCLMVPRRLVLSVHDEGVWVVPKPEAEQAKAEAETALRSTLSWCRSLPLNCEVGYHQSYGKAKK